MIDYIIVGQGLSGSIITLKLIEQGKSVCLIDNGDNQCSEIAAGVINPISGRRFTKPWKYEDITNDAISFYRTYETVFNTSFFDNLVIGKVLNHTKDKNEFLNRVEFDEQWTNKNRADLPESFNKSSLNTYFIKGYRLDTKIFLNSSLKYFKEQNLIRQEKLDYNDIKVSTKYIEYKNIKATKIIFCEGYNAKDNPHFKYLPWHPNKGEIIDAEYSGSPLNAMIQKHLFILPTTKGILRVGANYDRDNINTNTSYGIIKKYDDFINELSDLDYKIKEHKAGIRPGTQDRRPYIGTHPSNKNIIILNGFGSKGVSQIPYCSSLLLNHILKGEILPPEVNIERYIKYF
jgi:glycine/D-amino acid oxidase-like deaminating enzyme